jgi:hypothetical protein
MIGKTIWIFDVNRRVYKEDRSAPVWIEHWRPLEVTGETSRSWLTAYFKTKIPKKGGPNIAFTWEEVEKAAWVYGNRYKISKEISKLEYDKLKLVAEAMGYTPNQPEDKS